MRCIGFENDPKTLAFATHSVASDAILGYWNHNKTVQSLYFSISDADLLNAIDRMKFDSGETEIFVKVSSSKLEGGPLGALDQKIKKRG